MPVLVKKKQSKKKKKKHISPHAYRILCMAIYIICEIFLFIETTEPVACHEVPPWLRVSCVRRGRARRPWKRRIRRGWAVLRSWPCCTLTHYPAPCLYTLIRVRTEMPHFHRPSKNWKKQCGYKIIPASKRSTWWLTISSTESDSYSNEPWENWQKVWFWIIFILLWIWTRNSTTKATTTIPLEQIWISN